MPTIVTLDAALDEMLDAGLIRRADGVSTGDGAEASFQFKHALVQETVYASLLKQERQNLHRSAGLVLERLYADESDQYAAVLAHHFDEAGDDAKAFEYAVRAGDADARRYAHPEATAAYNHALELVRVLPDLPAERIVPLYLHRGREFELAGKYAEAMADYQAVSRLGRAHNLPVAELQALLAETLLRVTFTDVYDPKRGILLAEQALALARELDDRPAQAQALRNLVLANTFAETNPRLAIEYGEEGVRLARILHRPELVAQILNDLFYSYVGERDLTQTEVLLSEAVSLWESIGNQPMLNDALGSCTLLYYLKGEHVDALAMSARAAELGRLTDSAWARSYALMYAGHAHWEMGDPDNAINTMLDSILWGEQGGFVAPQLVVRADLGWVYAQLGNCEHGLTLVRQGLEVGTKYLQAFGRWANASYVRILIRHGQLDAAHLHMTEGPYAFDVPTLFLYNPMGDTPLAFARAEYALATGAPAEASAVLRDLYTDLTRREIRAGISELHYLAARAQLAQGEKDGAREALARAEQEARRQNGQWMLWRILTLQAQLAQQRGAPEASASAHEAVEILERIVARTPLQLQPSLRALPLAIELKTLVETLPMPVETAS